MTTRSVRLAASALTCALVLLAPAAALAGAGAKDAPCFHGGDVNADGVVSSGDAQLAFFIGLGSIQPTPEQLCAADCNGDGVVSSGDAQLIFLAALGAGACPANLPDGQLCTADAQCLSAHCGNDHCCAAGDCCFEAADCPPAYSGGATCDDPATCQGSRLAALCTSGYACDTTLVADDAGCGSELEADPCGDFVSVWCTGESEQQVSCLTSCTSDADCDPAAHCADVCVPDLPLGEPCDAAGDCLSELCAGGECCAADLDHDDVCDATTDACLGGDDSLDEDGDGVADACDPCPLDNPDDGNGDGRCDTADECPCGYRGPTCNDLQLIVHVPGYTVTRLMGCLPAGTLDLSYRAEDGWIYGVTDTNAVPADDNLFFRLHPDTLEVQRLGDPVAFTNPATSDLFRVDPAPAPFGGGKIYLSDWILDAPVRIDRVNPDFTGHEVVYASVSGVPYGTQTSNIVFSTGGNFGVNAFFAGQHGYSSILWRIGSGAPVTPEAWATISGVYDTRAVAFGPGGAFGTDLYAATSSVLNGFVGAPGAIHVLSANGSGALGGVQALVSEASGLIDFGIDILFDTVGSFGGDLLYRQADTQLLRVTPAGEVSLFSSCPQLGAGTMGGLTQLPDGTLILSMDDALFAIAPAP